MRGDVNGDGDLNAQDILIPINAINNLGSTSIDVGILPENMKWYLTDWDGNSLIEPSDILASINKINARTVEYVTAEPFIVSADGAITALVRPAVAQSTAQPDAQKITGDGEDTVISMKAEAAIIKAQRALASTGTAVDLNAVNRIFANIGDSSGPVVLFDMTGPIGVIAADNNRSAIDITANSQV